MPTMLSHVVVLEKDNEYVIDQAKKDLNQAIDELERDIGLLRSMMVDAAELEQSMTSELVLYLSRLLDSKINDHMKLVKLRRERARET